MKLQELLGMVAFPETPEDRDEAENAIRAMLADAWQEGHSTGRNDAYSLDPNPYRSTP